MIKLEKKQLLIILPFVLAFILFFFFRFYGIDKRIIFDWDQERDALVIRQILLEGKLTLIGPRVLGPGGFFLGPFFIYLLVPFYFFTKLHPQAMLYLLIFYNLTFFVCSFFILKKIFNKSLSLVFLMFWSLHPILINKDQISWNPLFVPIVIISSWWLFFKSLEKGFVKSWFWIGLLFGLGINFHFQLILIFPFVLVFLFSKREFLLRRIVFFILGFILVFSPLLLFDFRHQLLNTKLLVGFVSGSGSQANFTAWFPVWDNFIKGFLGFSFSFLSVVFYFLVLLLLIFFFKGEKKIWLRKFFLSTLVLWIEFPFAFSVFGNRPSEYYFDFLYPFLVFLFSFSMFKIFKKEYLVLSLVVFLFLLRGVELKNSLRPNSLGLYYKDKVAQRIAQIGEGKKFNVSFSVPLGMDAGYRYLFDFYGIKQTGNFDDALLQIIIPPDEKSEGIGGIGIFNSFQLPGSNVE